MGVENVKQETLQVSNSASDTGCRDAEIRRHRGLFGMVLDGNRRSCEDDGCCLEMLRSKSLARITLLREVEEGDRGL